MSRAEAGKPDVNKIPGVRSRKANEQSVTSPINQVANPTMEVNEMWFKSWFLNALRDDEIKGVIKQITADAVVSIKLQIPDSAKIVELEKRLESKEKTLQKTQDSLRVAQKQQLDVNEELSSTKEELKKFHGLSALKEMYELYLSMNSGTRKRLDGVVNGKDLLTFVCSGVQESQLERFWSVCNESLIDGDPDAKKMVLVFDKFFEVAQSLRTLDSLERLSVAAGDRFDNDFCTRIARSAPTGNVKEVLLQGYRYSVSQKIVKKSLVRV